MVHPIVVLPPQGFSHCSPGHLPVNKQINISNINIYLYFYVLRYLI